MIIPSWAWSALFDCFHSMFPQLFLPPLGGIQKGEGDIWIRRIGEKVAFGPKSGTMVDGAEKMKKWKEMRWNLKNLPKYDGIIFAVSPCTELGTKGKAASIKMTEKAENKAASGNQRKWKNRGSWFGERKPRQIYGWQMAGPENGFRQIWVDYCLDKANQ